MVVGRGADDQDASRRLIFSSWRNEWPRPYAILTSARRASEDASFIDSEVGGINGWICAGSRAHDSRWV